MEIGANFRPLTTVQAPDAYGGQVSDWENRGQQDERPRHGCAAKNLSAHQFVKHSVSGHECRLIDKYFEGLNFLCAGCPQLRLNEMELHDAQT
jgi:hypothetical protein